MGYVQHSNNKVILKDECSPAVLNGDFCQQLLVKAHGDPMSA